LLFPATFSANYDKKYKLPLVDDKQQQLVTAQHHQTAGCRGGRGLKATTAKATRANETLTSRPRLARLARQQRAVSVIGMDGRSQRK